MFETRDGNLFVVLAAVASGAAIGACSRWALSYWLNAKWATLPVGTLVCNLTGGLLIGLITAWLASHTAIHPALRLFLITGLLGGLTTFSTFSMESVTMLMQGDAIRALTHTFLHLAGSVGAAACGLMLGRMLFA